MKTRQYIGGEWETLLRSTLEDLFHDVGVRQIDAKRDHMGSHIKVLLNNGDSIRGETTNNPLSGSITINGKVKKHLNGPQAMRLIITMREFWEEFSGNPSHS